jgi:hypothetical protein
MRGFAMSKKIAEVVVEVLESAAKHAQMAAAKVVAEAQIANGPGRSGSECQVISR